MTCAICSQPGLPGDWVIPVDGAEICEMHLQMLRDNRVNMRSMGVPMTKWIAVADQSPPTGEPVVYMRRNGASGGRHAVGIAYWTVSKRWNPEAESTHCPAGFTHWFPLPEAP